MRPFDVDRAKVDYYDKSRGMFSGLDVEQIERFLLRNKAHYKRNCPHRSRIEEQTSVAATLDVEML